MSAVSSQPRAPPSVNLLLASREMSSLRPQDSSGLAAPDATFGPARDFGLLKRVSPGLVLFLLAFLTALLVMPGTWPPVSDTALRYQVTAWLWTSHTPDQGIPGRGGMLCPLYGIGQSLVMLPADLVASPFSADLGKRFFLVSYLTFPLVNALVVWVGYRLLLAFAFTVPQAIAGSLALLFGSTFLWHCQNNQENNLLLLNTTIGFLFFLRYTQVPRKYYLAIGSLALGFNLLVRLTTLADLCCVLVFPVVLESLAGRPFRAWSTRCSRYLADFFLVGAPVILGFLVLDRLYQYVRFGTLTDTYIGRWAQGIRSADPSLPASYPFSGSFLEGFFGPLIFPNKSVFLYDPLFTLACIAMFATWRRLSQPLRALFICVILLLFGTISGYARLVFWSGETSWGDRYVTTPVFLGALFAVPVCLKYTRLFLRSQTRLAMHSLLALIICMQLISLLWPSWVERIQAVQHPKDPSEQEAYFHLGMRVQNIAARLTGNWYNWGLNHSRSGDEVGPHPVFLIPFATSQHLSAARLLTIKGAWFAALALVFGCLLWLRKHARLADAIDASRGHACN